MANTRLSNQLSNLMLEKALGLLLLNLSSDEKRHWQSVLQSEIDDQLTRISCCNSLSHFKLQVVDAMTFQTKYRNKNS